MTCARAPPCPRRAPVLAMARTSGALERARRAVAEAAAAVKLDAPMPPRSDVRARARAAEPPQARSSFFEALEDLREAAGGDLTVAP
jgi:hypothetical protein